MEWVDYKKSVSSSRDAIVFPYYRDALSGCKGIGVDIGCGDGDLTSELAEQNSTKIIGFDLNGKDIENAQKKKSDFLHFVEGDVAKNALSMAGIKFDFAYSNCCFTHLSDEDVYHLFIDLHSCLKKDGLFTFLVPHYKWAKDMYDEVDSKPNGVTALPRYGGIQIFRFEEWYIETLKRCGFEIVSEAPILIPDDPSLETRYREKAGHPIFSAFQAKRLENVPGRKQMEKAFDVAHDNRKLEIELFWRRSLFFWGFIATALAGYAAAKSFNSSLSYIFALFGLVCSVVWAAGNRGSKYWQEYWERKVNFLQHNVTGNIFYDRTPIEPKKFSPFSPKRISVSKLTMGLSYFVVGLWLLLISAELL